MALAGTYTKDIVLPSSIAPLYKSRVNGRKTKPIGSTTTPYYSLTNIETARSGASASFRSMNNSRGEAIAINNRDGYTKSSQIAYNRAYAKAQDSVTSGSQASLGAAIFESRQSLAMITNRLLQAARGYRYLRQGQFRNFLYTYGIEAKGPHRRKIWNKPKEASGLWLEYWFGWAPTLSDIFSACEVLSSDWKSQDVKVFARGLDGENYTSVSASAGNIQKTTMTINVMLRGQYVISNPNLRLAQDLGLANPISIAWELIPFSWFADWFGNIGQVLGSLTDSFGTQWNGQSTTRYAVGKTHHEMWITGGDYCTFDVEYHAARRVVGGWTSPYLVFKGLDRLSLTRGLTAASLCVQLFKSKLRTTLPPADLSD